MVEPGDNLIIISVTSACELSQDLGKSAVTLGGLEGNPYLPQILGKMRHREKQTENVY